MNPSTPGSHSRWARASYSLSAVAFAAGVGVVALRVSVGPWPSLAGSLMAIPLGVWVIVRTSLYRRIYRGKSLAMVGLAVGFLGFSDSVGVLTYHALWRRAFRLTGREVVFENPAEGWRLRHPGQWSASSLKLGNVTTYFFRPGRVTPTLEFSVTVRPQSRGGDIESAVESFLMDLPKSGNTQILRRGVVPYPRFQKAYEVVYEDPLQPIVLRHRLIFVAGAEGLTVLSVVASPPWFERLQSDADRFLFSFEPV